MADPQDSNSKKSFWRKLFPGFKETDSRNAAGLNINLAAGGIYESFVDDAMNQGGVSASGADGEHPLSELPYNRFAKYNLFKAMADDSTIDSALKMHISHALSARSDTGEIIAIESTGNEKDPIVNDLRNSLSHIFNANCQAWAYSAALYGCWFPRVYGSQGKGVELVRSDYYSHPRFITMYEQAGQIAGYTSAYQNPTKGGIELIAPWKIVPFRIPIWKQMDTEPVRADASLFDMANDDYLADALMESQNYGTSLIETAFVPWTDLQEAILSLNMSRKNASRLERMIGVNTGKLSPQKAAQYLNIVSSQIQNVDKANSKASLRKGFVQTVINHLIPIFGDGRGRLDISTVEGSPNIDALADIDFHIKRLGSALGIDPALLGFGEMLSGGLGDGGFFRISVLAAIKANMLRHAIMAGCEQICDIHVAYKFGKVFLPGEKPWRIVFNSVSSALEREERENMEGRAGFATMLAQLIQVLDQDFATVDKNAFENYLFTDILKVPEEKFAIMFPKKKAEEAEQAAKDAAAAMNGESTVATQTITESAISSYISSF